MLLKAKSKKWLWINFKPPKLNIVSDNPLLLKQTFDAATQLHPIYRMRQCFTTLYSAYEKQVFGGMGGLLETNLGTSYLGFIYLLEADTS